MFGVEELCLHFRNVTSASEANNGLPLTVLCKSMCLPPSHNDLNHNTTRAPQHSPGGLDDTAPPSMLTIQSFCECTSHVGGGEAWEPADARHSCTLCRMKKGFVQTGQAGAIFPLGNEPRPSEMSSRQQSVGGGGSKDKPPAAEAVRPDEESERVR